MEHKFFLALVTPMDISSDEDDLNKCARMAAATRTGAFRVGIDIATYLYDMGIPKLYGYYLGLLDGSKYDEHNGHLAYLGN